MKPVAEIYLCQKGLVAVFDSEGKEISELSGKFYLDIIDKLKENMTEKTQVFPSFFRNDIMHIKKRKKTLLRRLKSLF